MSSQFFKNHILLAPKKFKNNYSYLFDGVDERININAVPTALATTTKGTWSCWVKPVDATPATSGTSISFAMNDSDNNKLELTITSEGKLRGLARHSTIHRWDLITNSAVFSDNVWSHIALVQDAVSPVLYVDGIAPAQSFTFSSVKSRWFNDLSLTNGRIGVTDSYPGGLVYFFNGNIDEVGFFNTNLSSSQILEIYNNGKPKDLRKHSANANLVSYFRMGDGDTWDGTNWTLIDKKGTNNGTSVNMEFADNELDVI